MEILFLMTKQPVYYVKGHGYGARVNHYFQLIHIYVHFKNKTTSLCSLCLSYVSTHYIITFPWKLTKVRLRGIASFWFFFFALHQHTYALKCYFFMVPEMAFFKNLCYLVWFILHCRFWVLLRTIEAVPKSVF